MEYMVRKISGRFKHLDESMLKKVRSELKLLLKSWGAIGPDEMGFVPNGNLPIWAEVEFLDNIIQFELECNPYLMSEIKSNMS